MSHLSRWMLAVVVAAALVGALALWVLDVEEGAVQSQIPLRPLDPPIRTGRHYYFPVMRMGLADTPTATPTLTPRPTLTPTFTPSPVVQGPTATPALLAPLARQRPKPSPYQRLQDYPRPPHDSGYGFHLNASAYPPEPKLMRERVIPLLKSMGATWVTVWAVDNERTESIKLLVDNGFEVILRLHPIGAPHPHYVPPVDLVRTYVNVGVHYFVTGNEPNLNRERTTDNLGETAEQWVRSSDNVKAAGGIPLFYPMSPGGDTPHREMLRYMLEWLKTHDALDSLDGAGVAIHNRPHNKPLEQRDDTSFLEYEYVDDLVRSYVGRSLPLFGTEAGYTFGDLVDPNFPRIDEWKHRDYNLAIVTGFRDGRWRDSLFVQNFWLLNGFGHDQFLADWWAGNPLYHGQDLPAVDALRQLPRFERRFSWSSPAP